MQLQFSILFVSVNPHLLKFKQGTPSKGAHANGHEEHKEDNEGTVMVRTDLQEEVKESSMHNGLFNFFFSNKRTIDKLRFRITQAIQEQLEGS